MTLETTGPLRVDAQNRRICTANRSDGQPCNGPAIAGGTVCRVHGGSAPQVRRKANLRLIELIDPAIATLAREMAAAERSSDRQHAANSILDRAGVPRKAEISSDDAKALLVERFLQLRDEYEAEQ